LHAVTVKGECVCLWRATRSGVNTHTHMRLAPLLVLSCAARVTGLASAAAPGVTRAILFDADGTLLASLPAHVTFCQTLADELGLNLDLPSPADLIASRKIAAAPMDNFFRKAGFPETAIDQCVDAYEKRFASECPVLPYAGIDGMLRRLSTWPEVSCGIVSSNTAANVRHALGTDLCGRFAFIDGIDNAPSDKGDAIAAALKRLAGATRGSLEAVYVGDTEKDWLKSSAVGLPFIGVDYGFEPLGEMVQMDETALGGAPVASTVADLQVLLTAWRNSPESTRLYASG
jgi:phosphoglycolate phosphatase-like HAD superfamily hydrolase